MLHARLYTIARRWIYIKPGGYSTLGWVRMCGPKFRPPPYNKTREYANLQPITKPFASWRTLFKTNQYFLPYKLGCISTFWQPIGKLKGKIQRKLCILQKCDLYLNQFSNKKGAIGKPERPKKHPIWAAHPRTHLSTKYPPGYKTIHWPHCKDTSGRTVDRVKHNSEVGRVLQIPCMFDLGKQ